jgi:hypothetical protein
VTLDSDWTGLDSTRLIRCVRTLRVSGHAVAQLVEAQRCKQEGRGFDFRWGHWNFSLLNPSGRSMALGSTQPVTVMGTRDVSWVVKVAGA